MTSLEERQQSYLFKLKLTRNVRQHITRLFGLLFGRSGWTEAGQGGGGQNSELALLGW